MTESISGALGNRLQQLGKELEAWSREHRDVSLAEHERAVLEAVRSALPELLGAVVEQSTTGVAAPETGLPPRCPDCGKRRRSHQWRKRDVLTVCGRVEYERPYHYCRRCKQGWAPVDACLELAPQQRVSGGLREWLVDVGVNVVYREGARLLRKLSGLAVAAETVRQHTVGLGLAVEAQEQAAVAQVQSSREAAETVQPAPGVLVVETDGVMVRYRDQQWHEVKLGVVGGQVDGRLREQSFVAARESAEAFGPRLVAEAARRGALEVVGWSGPLTGRGLAQLRELAVLGDGAAWIWNLAGEHFGQSTEIVDYFHACEHLWEVANGVFGTGTPAAADWAQARCGELYETGMEPVLQALSQAKAFTEEGGKVLARERGYFRSHRHRMDYPAFRKQGLPIGSGAAEGTAKYLVQHRMKRPGMRWSEPGAQGVLTLRAHLLAERSVVGVSPLPVPVACPRPRKPGAPAATTDAEAQAAA